MITKRGVCDEEFHDIDKDFDHTAKVELYPVRGGYFCKDCIMRVWDYGGSVPWEIVEILGLRKRVENRKLPGHCRGG